MKISILAILFLASTSAHAAGPFQGRDYSELCAGPQVTQGGYLLTCSSAQNSASIRQANVGETIAALPGKVAEGFLDAIMLSVLPDADTSSIYGYVRVLYNLKGKVIGYLAIDGYVNSEMEVKLQINTRYNVEGELVSAEVSDL